MKFKADFIFRKKKKEKEFKLDFLFREGAGFDKLVALIESNPRYVFKITKREKIDKRKKRSKDEGWVEVTHENYKGKILLSKNNGVCKATVTDTDSSLLIGAWTSWLARNASGLISGLDIRFE